MMHFLEFFTSVTLVSSLVLVAISTLIVYRYVLVKTRHLKHEESLNFMRKAVPKAFAVSMLSGCIVGIILGVVFYFAATLFEMRAIHRTLGPYAIVVVAAFIGLNGGWNLVKAKLAMVLKA